MYPLNDHLSPGDGMPPDGARTERALRTVRAASRILEEVADETGLIEGICRVAVEEGGYRFAWVGFADDGPERVVRPVAHAGHEAGYLRSIRVTWDESRSGRGPVGTAIRTGQAVVVRSVRSSEPFTPWREGAVARGYESCVALPIRRNGICIGALAIYSKEPDAFDGMEAVLLGELADKLATGLHFLRLQADHEATETALRNEKEAQEALRRILSLSLRPVSLEEKLDEVLEILFGVSWFRIERQGAIFLVDPREPLLHLATRRHLNPTLRELCAVVPFGHCLCGQAAAERRAISCGHLEHGHETTYPGILDHGHYCEPILSNDRLLGVLNLYVAAGHQGSDAERGFVKAVADTLAGLIERERMDAERQRLATVIEASPDLVGIVDTDGTPLYFNRAARTLLGCDDPADVDSCRIDTIFSNWAAALVKEEGIPKALEEGSWDGETMVRRSDGGETPVSQVILAPRNPQGEPAFVASICRDISDRKLAEEAVHAIAVREKQVANVVINSLPGIFFLVDRAWQLGRWNNDLERRLGYSAQELGSMSLLDLVCERDAAKLKRGLREAEEGPGASVEVELETSEGRRVPYFINAMLVPELEHAGSALVGIGIDISDRKEMESELEQQANRDCLTGLYNRRKFMEFLHAELFRSERYGRVFSLILFDIDRFKGINDRYGHDAGDAVLQTVATALCEALRASDIMARWGGEEFVLLAPETPAVDACRLAEKLRGYLEAQVIEPVGHVTASFGVAQHSGTESVEVLVKRADEALYRAKAKGRNRVCRAAG